MTPWEFRQLLAGHRARQRQTWQQLAQLAAWLLAPYSRKKHGVSAKHLITLPPDPLLAADDDADPAPRPVRRARRVS